ncbi:uncharacterized protein LAESUDRAFT_225530 [Laetiporus sulphureus 93-53]|uniref:Uncharacterized protein n=1 Tax=Laetiporus sulphureus 93-53 TaxID=1314785 RepID=A0A165DPL2_9APHY|nr:uncharacterized protein LAESUDRAFT_225530 [Laetiporus sulphureus 93-53]KZT05343.1 hypothetical protein LAESUDRAFT_225530 [Laetiporus sulphureus 93-53]
MAPHIPLGNMVHTPSLILYTMCLLLSCTSWALALLSVSLASPYPPLLLYYSFYYFHSHRAHIRYHLHTYIYAGSTHAYLSRMMFDSVLLHLSNDCAAVAVLAQVPTVAGTFSCRMPNVSRIDAM